MTQVAQIFEEEKQQALTQVAQIFEEEKRQALTQAAQIFEEEKRQAIKETEQKSMKNNSSRIVGLMIKKGYPTEEILSVVPNYSQDEIEALRKELL